MTTCRDRYRKCQIAFVKANKCVNLYFIILCYQCIIRSCVYYLLIKNDNFHEVTSKAIQYSTYWIAFFSFFFRFFQLKFLWPNDDARMAFMCLEDGLGSYCSIIQSSKKYALRKCMRKLSSKVLAQSGFACCI